jgi:hypothetical protein
MGVERLVTLSQPTRVVQSASQTTAVVACPPSIVGTIQSAQSGRFPLEVNLDGGACIENEQHPLFTWDGGGVDGVHTPI